MKQIPYGKSPSWPKSLPLSHIASLIVLAQRKAIYSYISIIYQ